MSYLPGKKQNSSTTKVEAIAIPNSSFLQHASYDQKNSSMTIDFKTGLQVVHNDIYPSVWQEFKESKSQGSYYARVIKKSGAGMQFIKPLKSSDVTKAKKEFSYAAAR